MALMDKLAKESKEFRSQFRQTALRDPVPTPRCSSSASGIAPRNENPSLVASAAEAKVSKPETRSQLERVQADCVHDDSSPAWLEKPSEAARERVVGPLLSFKPDTSDIV